MRKTVAAVLLNQRFLSMLADGEARFLAGLALGIIAGCAVKARLGTVTLSPSHALDHDAAEFAKRLRAIGGWTWDERGECWISSYLSR